MNYTDYIDTSKKKSNKNLKLKNGSYTAKKEKGNSIGSIDSSISKSINCINNTNYNHLYGNEMPKFLQQENPGKLQIFKTNSITEPEINITALNYNGYTSHDMRLLWTAFGNMPDEEKNTFLKGLVYRFGQKQIDLTCTLLNLKIEDYMTRTVIPSEYKNKLFKPKIKNIFQEEYPYDFLKSKLPALTNKPLPENKKNQSLLNKSNLYTQLLNRDFDCDEIKKQSSNLNPEEVRKCLEFVCDRCKKIQTFLKDINDIMMENDLKKDLLLLIKSINKIINGKYICCYSINSEEGNNLAVQASNWSFVESDSTNPSVILLSLPKASSNIPLSSIFAGKDILGKKTINEFNIYNSEHYTNEVANHYNIDMKCVLSTPIFAPDNNKVIGILEVINKKDDNDMPYFSIEDEYILKTMSSIWSIILRQCLIQENSEKNLDNIKNVFTTTKILNHTMNVDELIKISASLLKEITYSSNAHLFILDETGQSMITVLNDKRKSFLSNLGIVGDVMHTGKTVKTHKIYEHPLFNEEVDDLYDNTTIKTMICVPVKNSDGKVIGVFQLINKLPENKPFSTKDEDLIANYSSLISSVLKKVYLCKLLKKSIKKLKINNNMFRNIVENFPNVVLTLNADGSLKTINQKDMMFYDNEIQLMKEKSYTLWLESYPMLVADITKISRRGGIAYAYNYDMSGDDGEPFFVNYTILRFNKEDDPKYEGIFNDSIQLKINKLFESQDLEEDKDDHTMNIKNTIGRYINNINSILNNNEYGLENTTMICFENVSKEKRSMVAIEKVLGSTNVKEYIKVKDKNNHKKSQEITLLAVYIKNFNDIVNSAESTDKLTDITEKYLSYITKIISKNHGNIYNMIESKIIVTFGLPNSSTDDIENALNASHEIINDQDLLNRDINFYPEIELGLAIISGPAVTVVANTTNKAVFNIYGNIMNILDKQLKYTSKFFVNTLVSDNVNNVAKNIYHTRNIYSIKTEEKEYKLYSVETLLREELSQDILTSSICYELGLSDYYGKNWYGALNHFKKSFILINDGPSKAMIKRCEDILEKSKMAAST
ncbi:hypothetical protein BCR32DRAFT_288766 [Anaeromyces robustus]|uniref:Guanylate cyclase domain-containing protein n=1 Tax=Anaeromyces robustus TaxID=1754192 RepID=A0A1Y1XR84_9FUNG|nr:hypothetical protein BCR32DRAFT_288766 [Anaeromyces robustus]|eukprot:ORX88260.1 hypothetical protein BCR32DRAFT_288766 [Anaeromyces robustus]